MSEPTSFHGASLANGRRSGRSIVLLTVLVIGLIGVAIAKPWGTAVAPASSAPGIPGPAAATNAAVSPAATAADAPKAAAGAPGPDAFSGTRPAPGSAELALIRWRLLAPDDSVALFRTMAHARGMLVAAGEAPSGAAPATPLWTSRDGHTGSRCPSLSLCP